jgi:hypothetical protein
MNPGLARFGLAAAARRDVPGLDFVGSPENALVYT